MTKTKKRLALALLMLALAGCASPMATPGAGSFAGRMGAPAGISVGGAQDIGLFRNMVQSGAVPAAEAIRPEGLFAEHDLPVGEAPAGKTLHLAFGVGIAPALPAGDRAHFVQVGLASGLSEQDLKRPALKLVVAADRSGSMSGPKIEALRLALKQLVDRLNPEDQLGIVLFDDQVDVIAELQPVVDRAAFHRLIDTIEERGGTNIDAGLRRAYEMAAQAQVGEGQDRRVLLFTDAVPTVGTSDPESFSGLTSRYGEAGIGLTAFGIGLDFGAELAEAIAAQRGGNYVFLSGAEQVKTVFERDFDNLMMPAAYDMSLRVTAAPGFKLVDVYGASGFKAEEGAYAITAKTLFFSRNRGAIVLRLEPENAQTRLEAGKPLASGLLRYTERDGVTQREETIDATALGDLPTDDQGTYFAPASMQKTVALTNQYLAMRQASELYHASPKQIDAAKALLAKSKAELEAARTALKADDLQAEIDLVASLDAVIGQTR